MESAVREIKVMPGYRLKLCFENGSEAIINMSSRVKAMRFRRLSDPALFCTASIRGDDIVWLNGDDTIQASVNELLDSMLM